jgi:hypothetical protein
MPVTWAQVHWLAERFVRSELVWLLVNLDKDYTTTSPNALWPTWSAERIVEHFAANPD